MRLEPPTPDNLIELRRWFENKQAIEDWGGPGMLFHTSQTAFNQALEKAGTARTTSLCLVTGGELIGFGQFYSRLKHCHLCRLAIAPQRRGQGLIHFLVKSSAERGCAELAHSQLSLFVMRHNRAALKAYRKLGFVVAAYPEDHATEMPVQNCLYLTRPAFD